MSTSLENVLTDEPVENTNEPTQETQSASPAENETGEPKVSEEDEPIDGEEDWTGKDVSKAASKRMVPRDLYVEQRKQRQTLERERDYLRGQLEVYSKRGTPPQAQNSDQEEPSLEDTFFGDIGGTLQAIKEQAKNEAIAEFRKERQEEFNELCERTASEMEEKNPDYLEMEKIFVENAKDHPADMKRFFRSQNPAEYAYNWAKTFTKLSKHGSIEDLEKSLREKWEKEQQAQNRQESTLRAAAQTPKTQAGARGGGLEVTRTWQGPTELSSILGNGF